MVSRFQNLGVKNRLKFDDHWTLADFGRAHPRFRAGLAAAMQAYALHLYSTYRPSVNWYLQGLEHFSMAKGGQLLWPAHPSPRG